jgi:hypothetical protein
VKGKVVKGGKVVTSIDSPNGKLQVLADTINYNKSVNTLTLSGRCVVTITEDGRKPLRFVGDKARIEANQIEVQVDGGYSERNFPFEALSAALKKSPNLSTFRLNWVFIMGSWASGGSALYDRKSQTLREYASGGDDLVGQREHYSYTGVTERMLHSVAEKRRKQGRRASLGPLSFKFLTEYGAVRKAVPKHKKT